ncbi:MAG: BMP family protein [Anaerolineaceae bacterium]
MTKKVLILISGLLMISILLAACQTLNSTPQSKYKLAAIFPGVITDADYNTLGYIGITEVQRDLGVQTAYTENVPVEGVDQVIKGYINNGYNIIWMHGGQYVNQTVEIAPQFPDITFIAEGDVPVANPPTNLWFIDRNFQEGFYAIGATAALATRTGKIGYLGGPKLPFSFAEVHAIRQAIKDLGLADKVELKYVWAGDFNDPTTAHRLADGLIAEGVDFIMGSLNLGMYGAFEAVKAVPSKNIMITGKYIDKSGFAPKNYVTSLLYDFSKPLKEIVTRINAGETGGYYPLGFSTGESVQIPFRNVDPAVEIQVTKLLSKIKDGTIQVVKDTSEVK